MIIKVTGRYFNFGNGSELDARGQKGHAIEVFFTNEVTTWIQYDSKEELNTAREIFNEACLNNASLVDLSPCFVRTRIKTLKKDGKE